MIELPLVEEAKKEAAMREQARRRLSSFLRYRFHCEKKVLLWNWHIDYLCDVLEAVTLRQMRRIVINMPPRMLKSIIVSQTWHAWMIGREDGAMSCMLSAAATAKLAERDSRETRGILESAWYQKTFPRVKKGSKWTDNEWQTAGGATRNGAGAAGTITGFGGIHLLWDDLLLAPEANSETVREQRNQWLTETLPSRHNSPNIGTITGIQQRLHERDSTGFIKEKMKNPKFDQYEFICLPNEAPKKTTVEFRGKIYAQREAGELLFPEHLNRDSTESLKAGMSANYSGQYNQIPTKLEGGRLRPALLERSNLTPSQAMRDWGLIPTIFMDLATKAKETAKDDPDYSVIQVWARDQMMRRWLLYQWRKQAEHAEVAGALIAIKKAWKVGLCYAEKIGLQHTFRSTMRLKCQLMHVEYVHVLDAQMSASVDPITKVTPFLNALNSGIVIVPGAAPWLPEFEAEMRQWPKGAHDDQCLDIHALIHTFDGCKAINQVTTSDLVLTRRGWRRVLWAGQTGISPVITRGPLTGTRNHPVWTENRGWIPLESLTPLDTVVRVVSPSHGTGSLTTDTPNQNDANSPSIFTPIYNGSRRLALSTVQFGSFAEEQLRQEHTSTTWMAMMTIVFAICRCTVRKLMPKSMAEWSTRSGKPTRNWNNSGPSDDQSQSGTMRTRNPLNYSLELSLLPVNSAAVSSHSSSLAASSVSVLLHVENQSESLTAKRSGETGMRKRALDAAICLFTRIVRRFSVVRSVSTTQRWSDSVTPVPVFNLHVEEDHEYFANGVLVHNCVCAGYANAQWDMSVAEGDARPHHKDIADDAIAGNALRLLRRDGKPLTDDHGWAL